MGKIQKQDIKTVAELTSAGATAADLPNDDQIFVSALNINKTLKDAITEGNIGGGGGELNFLQLSNASWHGESGTTGFATYKDAAQSRPQDGTGGTASVTITTSNTNPLSGNNSLIITKPAGNLQGEGVSVGFAIDRASRARVLKIEFDYLVNSGTFNAGTNTTDSDLIVYIYNVDANQLIEPSTFKLYSNSATIADKFSGYFQTNAASTNYRLIFHVATTNSSAWSLKVDNVVVTPSKYVFGTPITDWVSYTPQLFGPTLGSGGSLTGRWRRVGDSVEIQAAAYRGTSGGSVGSGTYSLSLPSGMTIDNLKLVNDTNLGTGLVLDGGVAWYTGTAVRFGSDRLTIQLDQTSDVLQPNIPSANWWTSAFNNGFEIRASVPIQGWSSSVKMSDGYDGREIVFEATSSLTSIGNNTTITVPLSPVIDTVGGMSGGNSYVVRASGYYQIDGLFSATSNSSSASDRDLRIKINNVLVARSLGTFSFGGNNFVNKRAYLKAGDIVQWEIYTFAGALPSILNLHVGLNRISSPQTIAMGEVVKTTVASSSGQVIPNATFTAPDMNIKILDTHNSYNQSTRQWTQPVSGTGRIYGHLTLQISDQVIGSIQCRIIKNGISYAENRITIPNISNLYSININVGITGNAGDVWVVQIYHSSGANRPLWSDSAHNILTFELD